MKTHTVQFTSLELVTLRLAMGDSAAYQIQNIEKADIEYAIVLAELCLRFDEEFKPLVQADADAK